MIGSDNNEQTDSMKRERNVKICATLGPASDDYEMILQAYQVLQDKYNQTQLDMEKRQAQHDIFVMESVKEIEHLKKELKKVKKQNNSIEKEQINLMEYLE